MQPVCPVCQSTHFALSEIYICHGWRKVDEWDDDGRPVKFGKRSAPSEPTPLKEYPVVGGEPIAATHRLRGEGPNLVPPP